MSLTRKTASLLCQKESKQKLFFLLLAYAFFESRTSYPFFEIKPSSALFESKGE